MKAPPIRIALEVWTPKPRKRSVSQAWRARWARGDEAKNRAAQAIRQLRRLLDEAELSTKQEE